MRLGKIVLKIRAANTRFGNNVAGAAELAFAMHAPTIKNDIAFVIPLTEIPEDNDQDAGVNQRVRERFGVVVVLANDTSQADKTGILAYDLLHTVRSQLFRALLGWLVVEGEQGIAYRGGQLVEANSAYLWYMYEFELTYRVGNQVVADDGKRHVDIFEFDVDEDESETAVDLNKIYAQYMMSPNENYPWTKTPDLPLSTSMVDLEQLIDFVADDPRAGAFGRGYGFGFRTYDTDRRIT